MAGYVQFGIQSQRRLTKMYTDTKSSLDFVSKPAVNEDDELKKLHRKLRIQKDRLTTWGLRWSQTTETTDSPLVANDDIDESLSRAGLADVVGSIMATIKDILAEAEPLWAASGSANVGISSRAAEKAAEAKMLLVRWDRSRFEDLVKDLTSSIDTLYDISRVRHGETPKQRSKKSIELVVRPEKAFEKARMDAPQLVNPKRLRDFNGGRIVSVNDDGSESFSIEGGKQILYLEADTSDQQTFTRERPVLVEFAAYDLLYSFTGITPPMTRFEKLFNALQRDESGPEKADFGSLKLIGYFEESRNARFALVYELPEHAKAGLHMGVRKSHYPIPYYARLTDVLSHRSLEPPLEVKYRLAYNIAMSVFDLHSRGVVHGNLALSAVTFFETHVPGFPAQVQMGDDEVGTGADDWLTKMDLRRPYLTSYDLFSEAVSSDGSRFLEAASITWYRHRLDPRLTSRTSLTMESQQLDLYALALLLVDIGLWGSSWEMQHGTTISSIMMNVKEDPTSVCKLLASRCGTLYKNAFQACFEAVGSTSRRSHSRRGRVDVDLQKVYGKVLSCLEKCCSIEEDHDSADAAEDRKDFPSESLMNVLDGVDFHGSTPKPRNNQGFSDQALKRPTCHPTRDSFVGLKKEEKPKADIPYWKRPAGNDSQVLSAPINDVPPPQPQTKRRWVSRSRRNKSLPPDSTQHQNPLGEAEVPSIEPNVRVPAWIGETDLERKPVSQPTTSDSKADDTAEDYRDTTWSELDYGNSMFSADDWKSNPTTMSRRTSMSRRTKRSQSQAVQAAEDLTPAEPTEIDSDNIPARRTRVRFEEPSPWLWESISPNTIASKDEAKVVTVSCSSLRSILRKQTISCLILDLRVPPLYAQSRIRGALNVCVPVLQLADPTFNLAKLASTFGDSEERVQVLRWQEYEYILVYDMEQKEEDFAGLHTVKKFTDAGWTGRAGILKGGFESFAHVRDDLIDWSLPHSMEATDESADGNGLAALKAAMQSCQGCSRRKIKCRGATTNTWPCSACVGKNLDCYPPSKHLNEPSGLADKEQLDQREAGRGGTDSTAFNTRAMQDSEVINHGIERARKHLNELYRLAEKDQPNQKEAERADAELNSWRVQRRIAVMNLSKKDQFRTDEHHASSSTNVEDGGPDANPTQEAADENTQDVAANENIEFPDKDEAEAGPKEKPRRFPAMQIMQEHLDIWHKFLMPQINEALRSFYRKHSKESVEISLETIGESPQKAKPTILVICTSVGKVKSVLKRRFNYDAATYGLMVCKGQIVRSGARKRRPRRSMLHGSDPHYEGKNTHHQQRPLNGASIGAHCEGQALPAVSFGGMVMIDGEPFGMSVHHMLDVPSDDEYDRNDDFSVTTIKSSKNDSFALQAPFVPDAPDHGLELSDYDSDTASYVSSEYDSDSETEKEPGDVDGIDPENCQEGYLITQPAFEDIGDNYFRDSEHMDEYLDNYTVARLHASSGIRRRYHGDGPPHEIDWALFRFNEDRMPTGNHIIGASTYCSIKTDYPTSCVPFVDLASHQVHAIGRTTGLTGGRVLEARATVKFQGRVTPAQSYAISGGLGVPGDSGAWIMENKKGRACGHVLAWSEKNKVAYFSPMEVMLEDIKETLGVRSVGFPKVKIGSPKVELKEYVTTIDNSLAELADGLNIQSVDRNDWPYGSRTQSKRPMTPRSAKGQRKSSSSDLDIMSGIEGMCLSGGRILQSSAL